MKEVEGEKETGMRGRNNGRREEATGRKNDGG